MLKIGWHIVIGELDYNNWETIDRPNSLSWKLRDPNYTNTISAKLKVQLSFFFHFLTVISKSIWINLTQKSGIVSAFLSNEYNNTIKLKQIYIIYHVALAYMINVEFILMMESTQYQLKSKDILI